jgi:hypothetical protein
MMPVDQLVTAPQRAPSKPISSSGLRPFHIPFSFQTWQSESRWVEAVPW